MPTDPNPLDHRDDFSGPVLRYGSLNSLFQVAFYIYLPGATVTALHSQLVPQWGVISQLRLGLSSRGPSALTKHRHVATFLFFFIALEPGVECSTRL